MKRMQGTIIGLQGTKTAKVSVERQWQHPLYQKSVKRNKTYACECQTDKFKVGDQVIIEACRPLSKTKSFKVIEKVGS
ncbi:MAG: 30S ribosomal protein S17 [Patescibacteria group bacterium]